MHVPNNFYGKIHGKTINDYVKQLDWNLKTYDERIALVEQLLAGGLQEFMQIYTDEYYEPCLGSGLDADGKVTGKSRATAENTNVWKAVQTLSSYLINSPDQPSTRKTKYKFYTNRDEFEKRVSKELKIIDGNKSNNDNYDVDTIDFLEEYSQNYKKEIVTNVTKKDCAKYAPLNSYQKTIDELKNASSDIKNKKEKYEEIKKIKELNKKIKIKEELIKKIKKEKDNNWSVESQLLFDKENDNLKNLKIIRSRYVFRVDNAIKYLKTDQKLAKEGITKPIILRDLQPEKQMIDWNFIDFGNPEHLQILMFMPSKNMTTDLGLTLYDFENLIRDTAQQFGELQRDCVVLARNGRKMNEIVEEIYGVTSQSDYAEYKKCSKKVQRAISSVCNTMAKEYKHQKLYWYYLNYEKGEYKKCNRCGEVKLLEEFAVNKNSKDGRRNVCKSCKNR